MRNPLQKAGLALIIFCAAGNQAFAQDLPQDFNRLIRADIVAFDQPLVYNRFGSFNPFGMIFALGRDVVSADPRVAPVKHRTAEACGALTGAEGVDAPVAERVGRAGPEALSPGKVRLKDCKRARPLVLRGNVGDLLEVTVTNLLRPAQPDVSRSFCRNDRAAFPPEPGAPTQPYNHLCSSDRDPLGAEMADPEEAPAGGGAGANALDYDWPATRALSFVIPGLELTEESPAACRGLDAVAPGRSFTCTWRIEREGTHLFSSFAAPSGGEGDSGSAIHGLFGALIVEPEGSEWYRSQVTQAAFDTAWPKDEQKGGGARTGRITYEAAGAVARPILNLLGSDGAPWSEPPSLAGRATGVPTLRIVYGDLNAVIVPPLPPASEGLPEILGAKARYDGAEKAYREFTVIFHDELKTFYSEHFQELDDYSQFSGVGDGFAINYGASGMGSLLLANRKGMGPSAECVECVYEEFFLQSWVNGDPALRESFPDDPSNVHHSYLNDRVVFRNFHVGKETHVFHLHAHQWLAGDGAMAKNEEYGSYLDSQTIGPQQGLTYKIYNPSSVYSRSLDEVSPADGRLGWWAALGSGNRNRTPGDSIFHCHLYPHFAQGMWALWRVHDVVEDGSRRLPDGQQKPGLSLSLADAGPARPGTDLGDGTLRPGTPVPAVVPLPDYALPPLPTYGPKGFPGYPFYVDAVPGHRAPQPPLDMALDEAGSAMDGGLPRHVVTGGERSMTDRHVDELVSAQGKEAAGRLLVRRALALADFNVHLDKLDIEERPAAGAPGERRAMAFHAGGAPDPLDMPELRDAAGNAMQAAEGAYASVRIRRDGHVEPTADAADLGADPDDATREAFAGNPPFLVNGAPPKPGAPFADPCGAPSILSRYGPPLGAPGLLDNGRLRMIPDRLALDPAASLFQPDPMLRGFRRYEVSAVELDLVVNKAGWHDPQSRINVLTAEAEQFKNKVRGDAEPFFFRAYSGDCIEFRHTNEAPYYLERDDFQVKTPTDTIGQHIHLVKFDVTSADGSGNGWNYEDGTYAPGAVYERICAGVAGRGAAAMEAAGLRLLGRDCAVEGLEERLEGAHLSADRRHYQTTVQRWFADPFTGAYREQPPGGDPRTVWHDRTLRTVFTHDHFGPSSIQQHGFYNALLVEPAGIGPQGVWRSAWYDSKTGDPLGRAGLGTAEGEAGPATRVTPSGAVGAIASIIANEPIRPPSGAPPENTALEADIQERIRLRDAREYALAIADFALLYDPRGERHDGKGLGRLLRQAECAVGGACSDTVSEGGNPVSPERQERIQAGAAAPLRIGGGGGKGSGGGSLPVLDAADVAELAAARTAWQGRVGQPVHPPFRPEAISQKHHDPYLVNYKHEPFPLRLGARSGTGPDGACPAGVMAAPAVSDGDSIEDLKAGAAGRVDGVFRSDLHGDPCTPLIEAYEGDPVQVRLIQGAQEVQHTFTVEGVSWPRNVDEAYRHAAVDLPSRRLLMANSINSWAIVHAQEVGISEHFEADLTARIKGAAGAATSFARPSDAEIATPSADAPRTKADGLYHFGTVDALWNGAWGLTRTYETKPADTGPDAGALPLVPLARLAGAPATAGPFLPASKAVCPAEAPLVYAYAMAIALRDYVDGDIAAAAGGVGSAVRGPVYRRWTEGGDGHEGLFYDINNGVYDPDALVLVHVDPSEVRVVEQDDAPRLLAPDEARIRQRLARQWRRFGIEPYVLRVNAGDCVRWTVFNGFEGETLNDEAGDALMPKIARLNVNERDGSANGAVVPSSRLALMPGLIRLSDARQENFPFGDNLASGTDAKEASLRPATAEGAGGFTSTWLYAGVRVRSIADDEKAILKVQALAIQPDAEATGVWPNVDSGFSFCRSKPDAALGARRLPDGRLISAVETCSLVPYALGPTPIKSMSDPIGHAAHGLFGSIVVETAGTLLPQREAAGEVFGMPWDPSCIADGGFEDDLVDVVDIVPEWAMRRRAESVPAFCVRAGYSGTGSVVDDDMLMRPSATLTAARLPDTAEVRAMLEGAVPRREAGAPNVRLLPQPVPTTVFEQVLFYQDGLNLWGADRAPGRTRPVGDCRVCDDSYDWGEKGINYRSAPFFMRLAPLSDPFRHTLERQSWGDDGSIGPRRPVGGDNASPGDLNAVVFPPRLLSSSTAQVPTPFIRGRVGDVLNTYVLQPQGRARQRAFVMGGHPYDEFGRHGYGSGHSALIAPGKSLSAESRPAVGGCSVYRDGPGQIWSGGAWGLVDIAPAGTPAAACLAGP